MVDDDVVVVVDDVDDDVPVDANVCVDKAFLGGGNRTIGLLEMGSMVSCAGKCEFASTFFEWMRAHRVAEEVRPTTIGKRFDSRQDSDPTFTPAISGNVVAPLGCTPTAGARATLVAFRGIDEFVSTNDLVGSRWSLVLPSSFRFPSPFGRSCRRRPLGIIT